MTAVVAEGGSGVAVVAFMGCWCGTSSRGAVVVVVIVTVHCKSSLQYIVNHRYITINHRYIVFEIIVSLHYIIVTCYLHSSLHTLSYIAMVTTLEPCIPSQRRTP